MKAEPAQQRLLLELAEVDAELGRLNHRAGHLPEQQHYDEVSARHRDATDALAVSGVALEDLDAQIAKLESEVDSVRRREDRDRGLLDGGTISDAKQLEELQHELDTLQRRQSNLEDSLLEVMERREQLAAEQTAQQGAVADLDREVEQARAARDQALAGVEVSRTEQSARREALAARLESAIAELYERQRASSGTGAGRLQGGRCGACRIELDRGELGRIAAAADDEVLRCSECGAVLVRG